jgi:hypothetical protein
MRPVTRRRPRSLAKYMLFGLTVVLAAATLAVVASADNSKLYADGAGSPPACDDGPNVEGSVTGTDDSASFDVGAGNVVTGVCIKSGSTGGHSGPLGNGSYSGTFGPDGCYVVTGVGTQEVTVTRIGSGPECQAISHIDVLFGPPPPNGTAPPNGTVPPPEVKQPPAPQAPARPSAPAPVVAGARFTG